MKFSFKSVVGFGIPFAILMIAFRSFMVGGISTPSIITGLISGLFFGVTFTFFVNFFKAKVLRNIIVELNSNEKILKEDSANYVGSKELVSGKLVLTNQRLIFKSHPLNVQRYEISFTPAEIKNIFATKTLKLMKNGLRVDLTSNESYRFVVDNAGDWINMIQEIH